MSKEESPECMSENRAGKLHTPRSSFADELLESPSENSSGQVNLTGVLNMPELELQLPKNKLFPLLLLLAGAPNSPLLLQVSCVPQTQHIQNECIHFPTYRM